MTTTTIQRPTPIPGPTPTRPVRSRAPFGHAPLDLLAQARAGLVEAATASRACDRYVAAHLAALRAGAAVLAARALPRPTRGPRNVWLVLPHVAPELAEWGTFFAASALKRASIEAGIVRAATPREADDLLREAEHFVSLVAVLLGLPHQEVLAGGTSAIGGA